MVTGRPGGPEGPAIVVLAAIEARRGRLDVVAEAAKRRAPTDPTFLQRTARLLTLAGDEETAGRISALITNSGVPSTSPP